MARALIIKGADFSTNKVTIIDIESSVPCTGIAFDESTMTVTDADDIELDYTVTPANTTDAVTWQSSNTSVATVTNGTVKIVGIGTTTITASCGSYSDTLTFTADLYASPDWNGSTANIITDDGGHSIVRMDVNTTSVSTGRVVAAQIAQNSPYNIPLYDGNQTGTDFMPIQIPENCERIDISASGLYNNNGVVVIFLDALTSVTYADAIVSCAAITSETYSAVSNAFDSTVDVPEGANGFIVQLRLKNTPAEGTTPAQAGAATNFTAHFLPANEE